MRFVNGSLSIALLICAAVGATAATLQGVQSTGINISADGKPLDFAGDGLRCQGCPAGVLHRQRGYLYRCNACGCKTEARRTGGIIVFNPVE